MNTKKIFFTVLVLAQVLTSFAQDKHFTLTILHTNDTHSQIEACDDKGLKDVGGVLRRSSFINEVRAADSCVFLFDAGDFSQGTPYFNVFKGRVEVQLMNMMGYDAGTIGNHEFDNGLDTLAARIREANFPIVCANYKFKNKALRKCVKPYTVVERNGIRIGVFGLTPDGKGLVSAAVAKNAVYQDPFAAAKKAVKKLRKRNCDLIVCLSHLGYDTDKPTQVVCDKNLAKELSGVDVIIGGHTHTKMESAIWVNNIPIVQTGRKGVNVGRITITK